MHSGKGLKRSLELPINLSCDPAFVQLLKELAKANWILSSFVFFFDSQLSCYVSTICNNKSMELI